MEKQEPTGFGVMKQIFVEDLDLSLSIGMILTSEEYAWWITSKRTTYTK